MPLVSLVFIGVSAWCCGNDCILPVVHLVSLVFIGVSVWWFGNYSAQCLRCPWCLVGVLSGALVPGVPGVPA